MSVKFIKSSFILISFIIFSPMAYAEIIYESWGEETPVYSDNFDSASQYDDRYEYVADDSDYAPPVDSRKRFAEERDSDMDYAFESYPQLAKAGSRSYFSRLPSQLSGHGEKVILVDPKVHAWGAYSAKGKLIRAGIATAGAKWCKDLRRPCRTSAGTFRIYSLGNSECYSRKFPLGRGGAPMPYCMYFNGGQGLHGSYQTAEANLSHGCVRLRVGDAEWIRYNFATVGTKVIIRSY